MSLDKKAKVLTQATITIILLMSFITYVNNADAATMRISDKGTTLYYDGAVQWGDYHRLKDLINKNPKLLYISLNSRGGSAQEGRNIGILLRKSLLTTVVQENAICASACTSMFLGGVVRIVESSARMMYHPPYMEEYPQGWTMEHIALSAQNQTAIEIAHSVALVELNKEFQVVKFLLHNVYNLKTNSGILYTASPQELLDSGIATRVYTKTKGE